MSEGVGDSALPVDLAAWDDTVSRAAGKSLGRVHITSPAALSRILWYGPELGLAQAYVMRELEVHGDLDVLLPALREWPKGRSFRTTDLLNAFRQAIPILGSIPFSRRPPLPESQIRTRGRLHSRERDRSSVAPHYDTDSAFFRILLGENMAYSCALFNTDPASAAAGSQPEPSTSLEEAQTQKLDNICKSLHLDQVDSPVLLDIGCGWGSLSLYAAERYGARVVGVTLSRKQAEFGTNRAIERGLADLVRFDVCHWRDVKIVEADAVAAIEVGEHVGDSRYRSFASVLARSVRPDGRIIVQQMSRHGGHPGGGRFIESFITPDMAMRPVGETITMLEDAGLEFLWGRAMDLDYVSTITEWRRRFQRGREEIVQLLGEQRARVWDLYLVGALHAFRSKRMGVDQLILTRTAS